VTRIWNWLRAFGLFWYGFVIGDDWTVAAAVCAALLIVWGLLSAGFVAWWLLPLVVVASLGASIWRLERRSS
jgi:hypothetical protein